MFNIDNVLSSIDFESEPYPEPFQMPVTFLDLERGPCVDMMLPVADPCPNCGAFNMKVGDWVCVGHCMPCARKLGSYND